MASLTEQNSLPQSDTDISRGTALLESSKDLLEQYETRRDASLLTLATDHSTESIRLIPQDHPDYFLAWHQLAACLSVRSRISGSRGDLELAICYGKESMMCCPLNHPKRMYPFNVLARALLLRFQKYGDPIDLEFSIIYSRESLALHAAHHPEIDIPLAGLASAISTRHAHFGDAEDLEASIKYHFLGLSARSAGHSKRYISAYNIALALERRFLHHGTPADLDTALNYAEEALHSCPPEHHFRPQVLVCLADCLSARFRWYGDPADLDLYHTYILESLSLRPIGHPDRSKSLTNMADHFMIRYQAYGALSDIDIAIEYMQQALALRPAGHPGRRWTLTLLGDALFARFIEDGSEEQLQAAICCHEEALILCPLGYPRRSYLLSSLGVALRSRFERHGNITDLQSAITHLDEASKLATSFHVEVTTELAITFLHRYHVLQNVEDLNLAFDYLHKADEQTPTGHPHHLLIAKGFAAAYIAKYSMDSDCFNQEQAFSYCKRAVSYVPGGLKSRFVTSLEWIVGAHDQQHPSELDAYRYSLTLLDQYFTVTPHVSSRHEIHRTKTPPTLVSDAASCAIIAGQLELAVELLEYGRALLWTQLTRIRTRLDTLRDFNEDGKHLAEEFAHLSRQLEASNISPMLQSNHAQSEAAGRYRALARQWDAVVEKIRAVEGFSNFLAPAPFKDLQVAANEGPIIILNVSLLRSDALIILKDGPPRIIPLQFTVDEVHQMSVEFNNLFRIYTARGEEKRRGSHLIPLLRKLWYRAVYPVVCELEHLVPRGSRIWWCPTSNLVCLPLHAAGPYRKGTPNLPTIYVSSYTSTLSALIGARREQLTTHSMLAIGQPSPYKGFGQDQLQMVRKELDLIEGLCPPSMSFSRLYGPEATFDAAMDGLKSHSWIHLACHGKQDVEDPYESCFAMGDKPLRLLDLMQARLDHSQFAFLSACHTAVGDMATPDEMIHLAAGLQFSGFKSVVGTIGSVDDTTVADAAEEFYKNIFAEGGHCTDAARALNKTMESLKRKGMPLDQRAIFVHLGA